MPNVVKMRLRHVVVMWVSSRDCEVAKKRSPKHASRHVVTRHGEKEITYLIDAKNVSSPQQCGRETKEKKRRKTWIIFPGGATSFDSQFWATRLVQQSTRKEVTKKLPHVQRNTLRGINGVFAPQDHGQPLRIWSPFSYMLSALNFAVIDTFMGGILSTFHVTKM